MSRALVFWAAVMMLFAGGTIIFAAWKLTKPAEPGSATVVDAEAVAADAIASNDKWIDEFTLTERSGADFGTENLEGKVWVGSFFFASCTGSCQKQNNVLMTLQNEFGPDGVKFVSITCDPGTDTPAKLRDYAEGFNAHPDQWFFLTGDLDYIQRVGGEYFQLLVMKNTHQDRFAVVDKWGNVRGRYNWTDPIQLDRLKKVLPELMAEETEPAEFVKAKQERAEQLAQTTVDGAPEGAEPADKQPPSPEEVPEEETREEGAPEGEARNDQVSAPAMP